MKNIITMAESEGEVAFSGADTPLDWGVSEAGITIQKIDDDDVDEEELPAAPSVQRDSWSSKLAYLLTLVGFAGIGFGMIWRFPYLVRENGGIVFFIPYTIMLFLIGIPMFFLELAVGQRRQKGIIYAWNEISPSFGGLGMSCGCLCFLIGMYYTTLIAYCLSYFTGSFYPTFSWSNCSTVGSGDQKKEKECNVRTRRQEYLLGKSSRYYWFRRTLDISSDIDTPGNYNWLLCIFHIVGWIMIWLILLKGMKAIGKLVYLTTLFPYIVLLIFLFVNCFNEPGKAWLGAYRLLQPNWYKLVQPLTWLNAGSQIFFSLGLGMGCLVVFASYSPPRNNCFRDSMFVGLINCGTCCFAALVVFPMFGALGYRNYEKCFKDMKDVFPNMTATVADHYDIYFVTNAISWTDISVQKPVSARYGYGELTNDQDINYLRPHEKDPQIFTTFNPDFLNTDFVLKIKNCSIGQEATASGKGPAFMFVGFTEAVKEMAGPWSNILSCLFFFMLILLGINAEFAVVEAAVVAVEDLFHLGRPRSAAIICVTMMFLSLLLFPFGWGSYIFGLLDQYAASWALLLIAIIECVAVAWVYGLAHIAYDVHLMTGSKPNLYILLSWKFVTPTVIAILLLGSIVEFIIKSCKEGILYNVFQPEKSPKRTGEIEERLPSHSLATVALLLLVILLWIPLQTLLRKTNFKLLKDEEVIVPSFPEEELREEQNINVEKEEDQFNTLEKSIMGRQSLHFLQKHRDSVLRSASFRKSTRAASVTSRAASSASLAAKGSSRFNL